MVQKLCVGARQRTSSTLTDAACSKPPSPVNLGTAVGFFVSVVGDNDSDDNVDDVGDAVVQTDKRTKRSTRLSMDIYSKEGGDGKSASAPHA